MDLLEQPDIKKTYDRCKFIVKVWEHNFKKKYKRLPSKLDIREASSEVRHAYRKYFQLKTAALEQSFIDVDGFEEIGDSSKEDDITSQDVLSELDQNKVENLTSEKSASEHISVPEDIWGSHLNNKQDQAKIDLKKEVNKSNLNLTITKKLFCGSKFTKRNPRKSLSFSQKTKSDVCVEPKMSMSQPIPTAELHTDTFNSEEVLSDSEEIRLLNDNFKIVAPIVKTASQPVNIIQSVIQENYRPSLMTVDTGWLERVMKKSGSTIINPGTPSPSFQNVGIDTFSTSNQVFSENSRCSQSTKVDYDSDDIIDDSDEDSTVTKEQSSYHISKKKRVENNETFRNISGNKCNRNAINGQQSGSLENTKLNENIVEDHLVKNEGTLLVSSEIRIEPDKIRKNTKICEMHTRKIKKIKLTNIESKKSQAKKNTKRTKPLTEEQQISPRRSTRKTKVKASLEEFSSGFEEEEEDAFHTDTDEKDPEFTLDSKRSKFKIFDLEDEEICNQTNISLKMKNKKTKLLGTSKEKSSAKRNKKIEKMGSEDEIPDESEPYEIEFSVKPRVVTPRYKDIKTVLVEKRIATKTNKCKPPQVEEVDNKAEESHALKDKKQQAKQNLEKKIASGNLNDNFVRINLKKKVFVRGKNGKCFSKYKKALWKSKKAKALSGPDMDMGGCDGGMLTCFNCGQIGHFAQNCKATKGDVLLPVLPDQEEECPYPTLEEASQMAKESSLRVRIPKFVIGEKCKEHLEESDIASEESNKICVGEVHGCQEEEDFEDGLSDQLLAETLKLEEHIKKLDVRLYMDTVKVVKPYYNLNGNSSIIDTPKEVFDILSKFGHSSFRPGQEQAIMRILSGKSTLVTLSTGSGKSLCYQLPAYLYSQREPCISLIISPLVSLMDDQVVGIPKFMKAACLHSNQTKTQRQKILEAISLGELSVLLISPEAVVAGEKQSGFGSLLRKLPPIAFACIDEAHCVSQWSHNFRPSYLMICRVLRESLGVKTILGLTATATRTTRDSIINHLQIPDGQEGVISDIPLPDNLVLTVSKDTMRDHALLGLLMSERFMDCKSIIVYCTRRDECERIAAFLRTSLKSDQVVEQPTKKRKRVNLQAEPYHAGLSASRRRTIQNRFMAGELRIVVATVAFGMGINKSDIRAVIHFNMPSSFESYVQEVGRAGRDGLSAHCHVFLDSQGGDENELRRHIHSNSIDRHVIRKLLQKIFIPCSCTGQCPKHEVAFSIEDTIRSLDIPEENIATLLCYLELHDNKYIELLNPAYITCKVISYSGPLQIRKAAKECPPLAMALALHKSRDGEDPNVLEFPVIEVAAAMGWESGICKHKLKNLEWITDNNQPKRSTISVQFSNLGFRLFAPGNLSDDQLDEALDSLYNKVTDQEQKALMQLHTVHKTLVEVAESSYRSCISESGDSLIKRKVRDYFNSLDPFESMSGVKPKKFNEDQLVSDIRALICMYKDNTFTGRAVARIFQGIQSPNYPAVIWGRCKFWRSHLDIDFHTIVKIATREIIRMR